MTDNNETTNNNNNSSNTNLADYLAQLIKDKKQLSIFPNCFLHLERLLDEEINKIRTNLFQLSDVKTEPLELPDPIGNPITCTEKIYVPIKDYPDYNFVGRILGPRGMTAKQLEYETGCKIMVRGKGSMRDKKKEEQNRGKPNWEHLNDELHVLITVEDTENRCKVKLQRAKEEINKLLVPIAEGEDELKKRQLMELAIINGTYRDSKENKVVPNNLSGLIAGIRSNTSNQQQVSQLNQSSPGSLGAPLIISPAPHHAHLAAAHIAAAANLAAARMQQPVPTFDNLIYATTPSPYDYYLSLAELSPTNSTTTQAPHHLETSNVGKMMNLRRLASLRDHPYLTPSTTTTTTSP